MKCLRIKYYIIVMLACFSLISVGFSSWIISEPDPIYQEIEGLIEVDDVMRSGDYITAENIQSFDYYAFAFTTTTTNSTSGEELVLPTGEGILKYDITIDISNCMQLFGNSNALEIDFILNSDLFDQRENAESCINITTSINDTALTPTKNNVRDKLVEQYIVTDLTNSELQITLEYKFEITNYGLYNNLYINQLMNNTNKFGLSAKIIGVTV